MSTSRPFGNPNYGIPSNSIMSPTEKLTLDTLNERNKLAGDNIRLKQDVINLKYKWSKLFAAKRFNSIRRSPVKNFIRLSIAEQVELLDDIENILKPK
jgi:hypothetical protein